MNVILKGSAGTSFLDEIFQLACDILSKFLWIHEQVRIFIENFLKHFIELFMDVLVILKPRRISFFWIQKIIYQRYLFISLLRSVLNFLNFEYLGWICNFVSKVSLKFKYFGVVFLRMFQLYSEERKSLCLPNSFLHLRLNHLDYLFL